jgi:hypothetical protein
VASVVSFRLFDYAVMLFSDETVSTLETQPAAELFAAFSHPTRLVIL